MGVRAQCKLRFLEEEEEEEQGSPKREASLWLVVSKQRRVLCAIQHLPWQRKRETESGDYARGQPSVGYIEQSSTDKAVSLNGMKLCSSSPSTEIQMF